MCKILFSTTIWLALFLVGCNNAVLEVDLNTLQEKIYEPTAVKLLALGEEMILYLDHSTCVIDANQNSLVFKALKGQLGLYTDTLCLIKGNEFEVIENTDKSPTSTAVFNIINGIKEDVPFADIGKAFKQICDGNSQAILITDCEYFDKSGKNQDGFPFLSGAFKSWIEKGHCIYIVTEPYQEKYKGKMYDKKRFYFIFSDDKMQAPISHNLLGELQGNLNSSICSLFKMTNSDITVGRQKGNKMFDGNIETSDVDEKQGFEYTEILNSWDEIRTYVMKLDEYGEPLQNDEGTGTATPVPFVQNLVFNEGENYVITDVEVFATNITAQYLNDEKAVEIKESFVPDKQALRNGKLNVFVTEKVFDYLTDEYGGNLIRLDFVATQAVPKDYNSDIFTWQSIYQSDKATCVSKSIENVLMDIGINPAKADNRKVIHTVFLKTEAYK
ncbi:MAG: hypothetical protein LBG96_03400 [Tannerella sp.]|jgi:hypothetical protein|nr:hypothetical protein [Tannerella sp.]